MTVATLLDDSLSFAMTHSTFSGLFHHAEHRLHSLTDLTLPATSRTGLRLSSLATTVMTSYRSIELDLAARPTDRIFERYTESHLDILADIGPLS